jgi:hypothetical protein
LIRDVHPGPCFFTIPDPGYRGQKGTGSRIRIETLCLTDGFQVKQLLEPKLGPGFSLLDWKDRILSWLPFILVTESIKDFNLDPEAGEHSVDDQEGLAGTQETLEDQQRWASSYILSVN